MAHPLQILICPTAFKGSYSAITVAQWLDQLIQDCAQSAQLAIQTQLCPMADGGDSTLEILKFCLPDLQSRTVSVCGPLPRQDVSAEWAYHPATQTLYIEAAQAHGLAHIPDSHARNALEATSYGVGQLIRAALEQYGESLQTLVIALGGSASTDGGAGLLQALGMKLQTASGQTLPDQIGGGALGSVHKLILDQTLYFDRLNQVQIRILTDVQNPLLGEKGTAAVFSPQKGASSEEQTLLETNLTHWASLLRQNFPNISSDRPGMGAAGGLTFGLSIFNRVEIVSGFEALAEQVHLDRPLAQADWVLTGEGQIDDQSFYGKVVGGILKRSAARPHPPLVSLLCARQALSPEALKAYPNVHLFSLCEMGEVDRITLSRATELMQPQVSRILQQLQPQG